MCSRAAMLMISVVMLAVLPVARCKAGSCKAPPHGYYDSTSNGDWQNQTSCEWGDFCNLRCEPGYKLGHGRLCCCDNGHCEYTTDHEMECIPEEKSCKAPAHGYFHKFRDHDYWAIHSTCEDGDEASLGCKEGYHVGESSFCYCHDGDCGDELQCLPNGESCKAPAHASFRARGQSNQSTCEDGHQCDLECERGYHASDYLRCTCNDGECRHDVECVPDGRWCKAPAHGYFYSNRYGDDQTICEDGDCCTPNCYEGYYSAELRTGCVCDDGSFYREPLCLPREKSCNAPAHGYFDSYTYDHQKTCLDGDDCTLQCEHGYHRGGMASCECLNGTCFLPVECILIGQVIGSKSTIKDDRLPNTKSFSALRDLELKQAMPTPQSRLSWTTLGPAGLIAGVAGAFIIAKFARSFGANNPVPLLV